MLFSNYCQETRTKNGSRFYVNNKRVSRAKYIEAITLAAGIDCFNNTIQTKPDNSKIHRFFCVARNNIKY